MVALGREETAEIVVDANNISFRPQMTHSCKSLLQLNESSRIILDLQGKLANIGRGTGFLIGIGEPSGLGQSAIKRALRLIVSALLLMQLSQYIEKQDVQGLMICA